MKYLLTGDLGTSGIKVGLISETGDLVGSIYRSIYYRVPGPGRMIHNASSFVEETLQLIELVIERSKVTPQDILALALSGQMGGIIGVDSRCRPVTEFDMGLNLASERYNRWFQREYAEFVNLRSCGSPRNFPKILWWKREQPEVYSQVAKFLTLNSYVVACMTEQKIEDTFIDYTLLAFFGNEELDRLTWSEELSQELDVSIDKLPRVVKPWDMVGTVSRATAEKCGLLAGTPIFAGAGDQPAGFLGGNFCVPGTLVDVSGSSTILSLSVDKPVRDRKNPGLMYMISVIPGKYHAFTYINGGGTTIRWFIEEFMPNETEEQEKYQSLTKESEKLQPGADGLLFLPYFGGQQCPYEASVRGAFIGLSWWHKKEHLFRAILEALAYDHALGLSAMGRAFPQFSPEKIFVTGGGAKNPLWNQIKADVLSIPYVPVDDYKFPLLGNAIIAGYGLGLWNTFTPPFTQRDKYFDNVFNPNLERHRAYQKYLSIYRTLLSRPLRSTFSSVAELLEGGE